MPSATPITTNGVRLSTVVAGDGPAVVLVHGFPELGYSWRRQIEPLVRAGHRVIVPDLRGYGASSRPGAVAAYALDEVVRDLTGLLDALGLEQAVFVGHDWGASVAWHLAAVAPNRVRGVIGLSVPFAPPAALAPLTILRRRLGEDFYMNRFQPVGPVDADLARDPGAALRAMFASHGDDFSWTGSGDHLPPWLSPTEFDVFVTAFERTGFTGGLNYYRNIDRNWERARLAGVRTVSPPAAFLTGAEDFVRTFMPADRLADFCVDLRQHGVVAGAGHWLQQECPDEVTAFVLTFLADL